MAFQNWMALTRRMGVTLVAALALAGCASAPMPAEDGDIGAVSDPLEPVNRAIFAFNEKFDQVVLVPVSTVYRETVPDPGRRGVRNFVDNLYAPVTFVHDVLQLEIEQALGTFWRFVVNTTFGLGGLYNAAPEFGLPEKHFEDLGQTLGSYGAGSGPYIVLPILGPSNARDTVGLVGDAFLDPFALYAGANDAYWMSPTRAGTWAVDERSRQGEEIDKLRRTSLDYYATVRSLYEQYRNAKIRNNGTGGPISGVSRPTSGLTFDTPAPGGDAAEDQSGEAQRSENQPGRAKGPSK